jgi:hypothetical protein
VGGADGNDGRAGGHGAGGELACEPCLAPSAGAADRQGGRVPGAHLRQHAAERVDLGLPADQRGRAAGDGRARRGGQRPVHVDPRLRQGQQVIGACYDVGGKASLPVPAGTGAASGAAALREQPAGVVGSRPVVQRDQETRQPDRVAARAAACAVVWQADGAVQVDAGRLVRCAAAERGLGEDPDEKVARLLQVRLEPPARFWRPAGPQIRERLAAPQAGRAAEPFDGRRLVAVLPPDLGLPGQLEETKCVNRPFQRVRLGGDKKVMAFPALVRRDVKSAIAVTQRAAQGPHESAHVTILVTPHGGGDLIAPHPPAAGRHHEGQGFS